MGSRPSRCYIAAMIVRPDGDGLLLITQPDHAHLAGRIMERCAGLREHPRRALVLRAVAEHDAGWALPDASPILLAGSGEVADFIRAPAAIRQGVWPRAIALLDAEPWTAALVAEHALTVYGRFRGDEAWKAFFEELTLLRDPLIERSGLSHRELAEDYPYVRLGDLISLTFCTRSSELSQFGEWRVARDGDRVSVTPGLFDGQEIPFEIEARRLGPRTFASEPALLEAYAQAERVTLRGVAM